MSTEHGRVVAVTEVTFGSALTAAAAVGSTTLTVDDAGDFDETGGQLLLNGSVRAYTAVADDTGVITLASPLAAAAAEDDAVDVYDQLYGIASTEKQAEVVLAGDDGNVDTIQASIPHHLVEHLEEGIRGDQGEAVLLELLGDEWRIVDVLGAASSAPMKFWDSDRLIVAGPGDQTIALTYPPAAGSLHLRWNGLSQEASEFSVEGRTVTVPDPGGLLKAGDVLGCMYAYRDQPTPTPVLPVLSDVVLATGPGWYYQFEEDPAATVALDSSGNGNNMTYGVTHGGAGPLGKVATWANVEGQMKPSSSPYTDSVSLVAVVKVGAAAGEQRLLTSLGTIAANFNRWLGFSATGVPMWRLYNAPGDNLDTGISLADGLWHLVVWTLDGTERIPRIYTKAKNTASTVPTNNASDLRFDWVVGGATFVTLPLNLDLDELAFWPRKLTDSEVASLFEAWGGE